MPYGASAYGAAAYGGSANSANEQILFPLLNRAPNTLFTASLIFSGSEQFYDILTLQGSEPGSGPSGLEYKVYTSHGPGETPQLQVTVSGNGTAVVGAAPIIAVTAIIDSAVWGVGTDFSVRGRPRAQ